MTRRDLALVVLAALCAALVGPAALGHDQIPAADPGHPILLQGGDLYTVSHGVLPATDLLVDGGVIAAIGRDLDVPPGTEVIDAGGQRVYPGLIAPMTPIGLTEIGAVRATQDRTEVGDVTPEVLAEVAFNPDSEIIPTVRVHGIATIQVVPGGGFLSGRSFIARLDGWNRDDMTIVSADAMHLRWPGARLFSPRGGRGPSREEQRRRRRERLAELDDWLERARAYDAARAAGTLRARDLRLAALGPVVRGEMPLFVQADDWREIREVIAFARRQGVRVVLVGAREAESVIDELAQSGLPVLAGPPTSLPRHRDDDYDVAFRLMGALERAGIPFGYAALSWGGTDVRNMPFQLGRAIGHGLSPEGALRAATLANAEILGIADRLGSLDTGKEATLFVSAGDVFDFATQRVTLLMIAGRIVPLGDKQRELYEKYRRRRPLAAAAE